MVTSRKMIHTTHFKRLIRNDRSFFVGDRELKVFCSARTKYNLFIELLLHKKLSLMWFHCIVTGLLRNNSSNANWV